MNKKFYLITSNQDDDKMINIVNTALKGGVSMLQFRNKEKTDLEYEKTAIKLKKLCDDFNVPLIINDRLDIALKIKANGVHLGQDDFEIAKAKKIIPKNFILGATAHNLKEAKSAELAGADYLGIGDVFGTASKSDTHRINLEKLKNIKSQIQIPIYAIGGISIENIPLLNSNYCDGIAVIGAVFNAENPLNATKKIVDLLEKFDDK
ncbi:MAG: thiamine phosphate synthase [Clostridia bacterium]|nr:thiamine phosphate synthase [Clostridia bacterium]